MESLIINTLQFQLIFHLDLWQFIEIIVRVLGLQKEPFYEKLNLVLLFKAKMVMMDYNMITKIPFKHIACSIIYISLKIV